MVIFLLNLFQVGLPDPSLVAVGEAHAEEVPAAELRKMLEANDAIVP